MRNIKHCTKGSNVAKHGWTFNHVIDFNNSKLIDKANNRSRHWSHGTRQNLLGRTIIGALNSLTETLIIIFLAFLTFFLAHIFIF